MAGHSSRVVIFAALAGNFLIAITKAGAAAYTGSSAMFSEAIHSAVDTGNQGLLLYGLHRSKRSPDARHPYGYGRELYFWAFVVALLIFAVGSGVSIYEGIHKIFNPEPIENPMVNFIVLGAAMVFEGAAWIIAFREFRTSVKDGKYFAAVSASKDPSIFAVLLEDSAAMLGLIVATLGLALGLWLDIPELDGVASVAIGILLAAIAWVLAYETKGLLVGEGADPEVEVAIRRIIAQQSHVLKTNEILSLQNGPMDILVTLSLDFKDGVSSENVEDTISRMEKQIRTARPDVRKVFIEAQSWRAHNRAANAG
ncbi:cation diffusion facilitator family transporter [Kiloniella laminariae]|uniref:Cation diffusion facilitator family transporter n=1 Tax=Kiloniella laminariae TaxID=454162 RepID=A0ABT4LGD7_9PROT|nr:cation diffusion facilitator family transporter [Kiloniella laminariae]MCZ4280153.1 cation diffusion facilitator family transporter [Kiloniella laminariae]